MKDEIKEMLDDLKFTNNDVMWCDKITLNVEQSHLLLDYITNLQEKVEQYENPNDLTLITMYCDLKAKDKIKQLQEENDRLKSQINLLEDNRTYLNNVIDKAIEYITNNCILSDEWEDLDFCNFIPTGRIEYKHLSKIKIKNLLNILQGSDK